MLVVTELVVSGIQLFKLSNEHFVIKSKLGRLFWNPNHNFLFHIYEILKVHFYPFDLCCWYCKYCGLIPFFVIFFFKHKHPYLIVGKAVAPVGGHWPGSAHSPLFLCVWCFDRLPHSNHCDCLFQVYNAELLEVLMSKFSRKFFSDNYGLCTISTFLLSTEFDWNMWHPRWLLSFYTLNRHHTLYILNLEISDKKHKNHS